MWLTLQLFILGLFGGFGFRIGELLAREFIVNPVVQWLHRPAKVPPPSRTDWDVIWSREHVNIPGMPKPPTPGEFTDGA